MPGFFQATEPLSPPARGLVVWSIKVQGILPAKKMLPP